jgi:Fe-S-cluster containining protein
MNYSEFMVMLERLYNEENKHLRLPILKTCVEYFFSASLIKPCPLLTDKKCLVYSDRPLNCRMYGLWPKEVYEERVQRFMKATGLKKEEIPLNTQCEYVQRKEKNDPLTKEIIDALYKSLTDIDIATGDFTEEQSKKKHNQRTFHDWFMVTVFGEKTLSDLSSFYIAAETQDIVDDFVIQMCNQIDKVGESVFKKK